jgi:hypothetical protein
MAMTASIKRRCERQKRKSVSSFFRQRNARRRPDAPQQVSLISTGGIGVGKLRRREAQARNLPASERDAEIHRLQRGRVAAPASAIGLLERESLLDPEPVRDTEAVPACERWVGLAGLQIPAGAGTARCDRATDRKRREHDHLDLSCHQRALLGHLAVDLEYAARPIIRRRRVGPDLRAIDRRCHRLDVVDRCLRVALVKRTAAGNGEAKSDRGGETSKPRQLRSVLTTSGNSTIPGKKWRAKSTCGKCVIFSSLDL